MKREAIMAVVCIALVVSYAFWVFADKSPESYARRSLELNILDTLSVVFVDPWNVVTPAGGYIVRFTDRNGDLWGAWEEWNVLTKNEERGVWIMYCQTPRPAKYDAMEDWTTIKEQ